MTNWLQLFKEATEEVLKEIKPFLGSERANKAMGRGAGGDITKYIDRLAEETVIKTLETNNVSCTLISEECGVRKLGEECSDHVILDSIDGTTNATRSIPFVCTSIAHSKSDSLKVASKEDNGKTTKVSNQKLEKNCFFVGLRAGSTFLLKADDFQIKQTIGNLDKVWKFNDENVNGGIKVKRDLLYTC